MNYKATITLPPNVFDSDEVIKWLFGGAMCFLSGLGPDRVEELISQVLVDTGAKTVTLPLNKPDDIKLMSAILLLIGTMAGVRGTVQRANDGEGNLVGFLSGWGLDIEDGTSFDF